MWCFRSEIISSNLLPTPRVGETERYSDANVGFGEYAFHDYPFAIEGR